VPTLSQIHQRADRRVERHAVWKGYVCFARHVRH
jgi:hypothetical protein